MVGGRKKVISFFAGTAWLRSCRFLFHKFIQRDKSHKVIGNADVLPPLAAALIRCFNVDRLDKLPQGVGGKLLQILVFVYSLDKLLSAKTVGRLTLWSNLVISLGSRNSLIWFADITN
jgi:hypothetical protein